jgi:uncharacterized spore protein YtfJ
VTENEAPTGAVTNLANVAGRIGATLSNLTDVSAERVFREPVHVGDRVVITAAAFDIAGGMGVGTGGDNIGNGGGGGGAGGHSEGRPVAVIDIGPDGVKVRPIIDLTRIGVTLLVGVFAIWRATRKR